MSRKKKILNPAPHTCLRCGATFIQNYGNYQRAVCAVCKDQLNHGFKQFEATYVREAEYVSDGWDKY